MDVGNARFIFVLLILLFLSSVASALYNDIGNDSCFKIYSDKKDYYYSGFANSEVVTELTFENNCGIDIPDVQLGVFIPTEYAADFKFRKAELWKNVNHPYSTWEFDHNELNYVTDWDADLNLAGQQKTGYAETQTVKVGETDYPVNYYSYTLEGVKCEIPDAFPGRCYYYIPIYNKVWHDNYYWEWGDITQQLVQSTDIQNIDIGKFGFTLKRGWKDVTIPKDFHKKLRVYFSPPPHTSGEFIIAGRSKAFPGIYYSVLDPSWWDENFPERYAINIGSTHSAIDTYYTFEVLNVDTSSWACTDNNGITIVSVPDNNEIDANVAGNCGSGDANISFRSQFGIPADTGLDASDTNGYYIYVRDTRADPKRNIKNVYFIDDFEDGDYTSGPVWTVGLGGWAVTDVNKHGGTYSLSTSANAEIYTSSAGTGTGDFNYSAWVYVGAVGNQQFQLEDSGESNTTRVTVQDINFYCSRTNGTTVNMNVMPSVDTWYKLQIQYKNSASASDCYVFDSGGSLIASSVGGSQGAYTIERVAIYSDEAKPSNWDDIIYGGSALAVDSTITLGSKEVRTGVSTDFNYTALAILDPENGITSTTIDLNDISAYRDATPTSWQWDENGTTFSTDQNTTRAFTTANDYNICLYVVAEDENATEYSDQECKTITVRQFPQGVDYTWSINDYSITDVNVQFTGSATIDGTGESYWWFYNDTNYFATDINADVGFHTYGDKNVCFVVNDNDTNKQTCKVFDSTKVTVKIPLDEGDGITTITPFNIYAHTIPAQDYDGLSENTNFFIFTETPTNYSVYIDVNADWYGRYYSIASDGTLQILQPYLVNTTDASSIKIVTQSIVDYLPIANVRIKIYKIIGGSERELLEDVTTDSKGEAFTSGIVNDIYEYEIYYQNNLVDNFDITITSTTIYILFNPELVEELEPSTYVDVAFTPAYTALSGILADIDLIQTIFYLNIDVNQITIYAKQIDINGNVPDANLYHTIITSGITSGYQNSINIGTDLGGWDINKTLRIYVKVELSDGVSFTKKHNYYAPAGITGATWTILTTDIYGMVGCEEGQPCALLILISLLLSVGLTAGIITASPFQDSAAIGVMFCFFLGIFALISWVPFFLMAVVSLVTLIIAMAGRGGL